MALPFLPAEHIEPAFRNIEEHASNGTQLELVTYIKDTWILGNWHPKLVTYIKDTWILGNWHPIGASLIRPYVQTMMLKDGI